MMAMMSSVNSYLNCADCLHGVFEACPYSDRNEYACCFNDVCGSLCGRYPCSESSTPPTSECVLDCRSRGGSCCTEYCSNSVCEDILVWGEAQYDSNENTKWMPIENEDGVTFRSETHLIKFGKKFYLQSFINKVITETPKSDYFNSTFNDTFTVHKIKESTTQDISSFYPVNVSTLRSFREYMIMQNTDCMGNKFGYVFRTCNIYREFKLIYSPSIECDKIYENRVDCQPSRYNLSGVGVSREPSWILVTLLILYVYRIENIYL